MLKIGVLGASELAKEHIRILLELKSQFELIGFYDPINDLAEDIVDSFSLKRFEKFEDLLDQVDCVDIVSPTTRHFEFATVALRKSKHIFIEKPLTQTIDEAKSLISLSREASVKVQIGSIDRFNQAFQQSLKFVKRPMFIETHRLNHYSIEMESSSLVMDLMMNDIDVVLSVVKSSVRKVAVSGTTVFSNDTDIINARIEFDNGCIASLTASRVAQQKKNVASFYQSNSIINVNFLLNELEIVNSFDEVDQKKIISERPIINETNPKLEEFKSFYESITKDLDPIVSLANGYDSLCVAHKIVELLNHSNIVLNDNN